MVFRRVVRGQRQMVIRDRPEHEPEPETAPEPDPEPESGPEPKPKVLSPEQRHISTQQVVAIFAEHLQEVEQSIDIEAGFREMGVDSVVSMDVIMSLEEEYNLELASTLLFEHTTIIDLIDYLETCIEPNTYTELNLQNDESGVVKTINTNVTRPLEASLEPSLEPRFNDVPKVKTTIPPTAYQIAIIGLSGRFPQAADLDEFWKNLCEGKDCIEEIPIQRWDFREYFDDDKDNENKSYGKWGGFINDHDKFDPLFFAISPREATEMDPQQRLFLECSWSVMDQTLIHN